MRIPVGYARAAWGCAIVLVAALSACASPPAGPEPIARPTGICIPVKALSEWQPLDDRRVLLWAPDDLRPHLLTLTTAIPGLGIAADLEVIDGDLNDLICADGRDQIILCDGSERSASIASIEYLSEQRAAELLDEPVMTL